MANGDSKATASKLANRINFNIIQRDSVLLLEKGIAINKEDKFRNQQAIVTVAVPVGKRIFINDNVGWGENVHINMGRDNDYWDWENNIETQSYNWKHNVEYIMTAKGLERVDRRSDDEEDNSGDDVIEEFKKSKEELKRDIDRQQRELDEKKRELERSGDSIKRPGDSTYRFKQEITTGTKAKSIKEVKPVKAVETNELFINPMTMPLSKLNF
jgi:hypothetical protein